MVQVVQIIPLRKQRPYLSYMVKLMATDFLIIGSQGISCHGINLIRREYPGFSTWKADAKFFRGNKNIYLHISFLHIDVTQVVEILPLS